MKSLHFDLFVSESNWGFDLDSGWGNGYVVLPRGSIFFGRDCDSIPVYAHGGLTFSSFGDDFPRNDIPNEYRTRDYWIVGFDTAHYGDTREDWSKHAVVLETFDLMQKLKHHEQKVRKTIDGNS